MEELFSLLNFLEPERFPSEQTFMTEFGDLKTEEQVNGPLNLRKNAVGFYFNLQWVLDSSTNIVSVCFRFRNYRAF